MGSPVSPIVVNLFIASLEQKAISTAPEKCRPHIWKRYVDNTLEIIKGKAEMLTEHLNQMDNTGNIKFAFEEGENGSIAFLDTKLTRKEDGKVTV